MGRIAKIKRLLIEEVNKRILQEQEKNVLELQNKEIDNIINNIKSNKILKNKLSLTDHADDTTILDSLSHNVHAHYDPISSHLSLQFPHLGKHHDIEIDIEGSLATHHDSHKLNIGPHVVIGAGIKIPLSHKSAH